MIQAGELRETVVIESASEVQDSMGEPDETWSTLATVRASVRALSANEVNASDATAGRTTFRFAFRYQAALRPGVFTAKMRATWDSRTFDLLPPTHDPKNREIVVHGLERS